MLICGWLWCYVDSEVAFGVYRFDGFGSDGCGVAFVNSVVYCDFFYFVVNLVVNRFCLICVLYRLVVFLVLGLVVWVWCFALLLDLVISVACECVCDLFGVVSGGIVVC